MGAVRALAKAVQANTLTPCRVTTTANLVLSGLPVIDGVTVIAGDRVLVKNQTDATENGIWVASSGAWVRASDFNGVSDLVSGSVVAVIEGSLSAEALYHTSFSGAYSAGSTTVAFVRAYDQSLAPGWDVLLGQPPGSGWTEKIREDVSDEVGDLYIIVDTLSELENLTGSDPEDVVKVLGRLVAGDGYAGEFRWVSGDQSANIVSDPGKGVWVAPSTAPDGSSGAWTRLLTAGSYQAEWWGVIGDDSTDNTTNVQRAIDYVDAQSHATASEGGTLCFGAGTFRWSSVTLGNRVSIKGLGPYVTHFITTSTTDQLIKVGAGLIYSNDNKT